VKEKRKRRTDVSMLPRRPVPLLHWHLEDDRAVNKRRTGFDERFAGLKAAEEVEGGELEETGEAFIGPEAAGGGGM
jgi:hypothetical protein